MAQILDKQGLQHYANKMCNADNRKVGSKSLPTVLNDIDTAIDGFKTLFESEYGTPVNMELENNENVFSIGTGTNIDKKDDVENSFTDLTLNGNSLVNCIKKGAFSSSSNFTILENNPIIKGEKITLTSKGNVNQVRISLKPDQGMIKPNTKYTFIFDVFENKLSGKMYLTYTNNNAVDISYFSYQNFIEGKATGQFKYVLTSATNIENVNCLFRTMIWNDSVAGESITFSVRILEGDWTNKPLPQYFEGMKSVGQDDVNGHKIEILSSVGKENLINNSDMYINITDSIQASLDLSFKNKEDFYKVENKIITMSLDIDVENMKPLSNGNNRVGMEVAIECEDGTKNYCGLWHYGNFTGRKSITHTYPSAIKRIAYAGIYIQTDATKCIVGRPKIEISDVATSWCPSKTDDLSNLQSFMNKKEILLNEPLRSVGNTKDTIEKVNGEWKIVRRCGEVILDNSFSYNNHSNDNANFDEYKIFNFPVNTINQSSSISDKFPQTANDRIICSSKIVYIRFSKAKEINTLEKCQQWFANNPTKIVYTLETPIIEDISPVTLQCWKNGTISIDEILPVETTHTVALNKSAQIQKNIEELTLLRNRVETLEKQYDNSTLNQAYELELLRLDMELDNIV